MVDKISEDFKQSMKAQDKLRTSVLSFLRSQLNYLAIEKKIESKNLTDTDVITVIRKLIKQHSDSIEQFRKGGRADLADKESAEMEILKAYLPKELSGAELKSLIEEVIKNTGASSLKDMSAVMKELVAKAAGRADNNTLSRLVKERLLKG